MLKLCTGTQTQTVSQNKNKKGLDSPYVGLSRVGNKAMLICFVSDNGFIIQREFMMRFVAVSFACSIVFEFSNIQGNKEKNNFNIKHNFFI